LTMKALKIFGKACGNHEKCDTSVKDSKSCLDGQIIPEGRVCIEMRRARPDEAENLTRISFAAKAIWGYPRHYFRIWKNELTVTKSYIAENDLWVAEEGGVAVGYYSLVYLREGLSLSGLILTRGYWLDHMFIDPAFIARGIGRAMFAFLLSRCLEKEIGEFRVLADPNAAGFYEKMGCSHLMDLPSTIPGRTTPCLRYVL
jgi:GNAT superfamily N-acetyltransferase